MNETINPAEPDSAPGTMKLENFGAENPDMPGNGNANGENTDIVPGGQTGQPSSEETANLETILGISVSLSVELGRVRMNINELLHLTHGSVVDLNRFAGSPMDLLANGTLIAHGEVVVVNERFGIRLTDVVSPAERIKGLK